MRRSDFFFDSFSMLRFLIFSFILFFQYLGDSQNPGFDFLYESSQAYSDIDSAIAYPELVEDLYIECDSISYLYPMSILEKQKARFTHLRFISFEYGCDFDIIPAWVLELPKLTAIYSNGYPTLYSIPKDPLKLVKIAVSCPKHLNPYDWQKKIYRLRNLKVMYLGFLRDVEIDKTISNIKNLETLVITSSQGDIKFPETFSKMNHLKVFSIEQSLECVSFPKYLPVSLEYISIRYTHVHTINKNIKLLTKLKYLDLSNSSIESFPIDFNFAQLNYFAAPSDLFSSDKWAEIQRVVETVVVGPDRISKTEGSRFEKRN